MTVSRRPIPAPPPPVPPEIISCDCGDMLTLGGTAFQREEDAAWFSARHAKCRKEK